jgi:hypothetical protein
MYLTLTVFRVQNYQTITVAAWPKAWNVIAQTLRSWVQIPLEVFMSAFVLSV